MRVRDGRLARAVGDAALAVAVVGGAFVLSQAFGTPAPWPMPGRPASPAAARAPRASPPPTAPAEAVGLQVDFLGAGPERAVLVLAGGHAAVVDCASPIAAAMVRARLAAAGLARLDLVAATTPAAAPEAGLTALLERVPVGRVVVPGPTPAPAFAAVLAEARRLGVPMTLAQPGATWAVGPAALTWVSPPAAGEPDAHQPPAAAAVQVALGQVRVLLAGTLDPATEDALVRSAAPLRAQVLEVPAGGRAGSLSPGFLAAVRPDVAVVGPTAAHPVDPAVLTELVQAGAAVVHRDRFSAVAVATDGRRVAVTFLPRASEAPPPAA